MVLSSCLQVCFGRKPFIKIRMSLESDWENEKAQRPALDKLAFESPWLRDIELISMRPLSNCRYATRIAQG